MGLTEKPARTEPSPELPRLAYSKSDAALTLGVSVDYFPCATQTATGR